MILPLLKIHEYDMSYIKTCIDILVHFVQRAVTELYHIMYIYLYWYCMVFRITSTKNVKYLPPSCPFVCVFFVR